MKDEAERIAKGPAIFTARNYRTGQLWPHALVGSHTSCKSLLSPPAEPVAGCVGCQPVRRALAAGEAGEGVGG